MAPLFDVTSLTLLGRVQAQQPEAWDRLVELYAPLVRHWCRKSGLSPEDTADVFQDEVTGMTYYRVDLAPLAEELPKLEDQDLLPGMPVEAYLRTDDRTPLSYLTKPLTDYFGRAFRKS